MNNSKIIEENSVKSGKLFIVSTPIGNKSDYTLRAIDVLKISDVVVCEELKEGARILRELNLSKDLIPLNEQNEETAAYEVIKVIEEGKKVSLVSDCGTPLFADPGSFLMKLAVEKDIDIEVVPGASSIMTALVRSGMDMQSFFYAGFLNRKPEERIIELQELSEINSTIVLLETPYRLLPVLAACKEIMPERRAYIGFNLTMTYESHHYGTFTELFEKFGEDKIKAEFVICFAGKANISNKRFTKFQKPEFRDTRRRTPSKYGNSRDDGRSNYGRRDDNRGNRDDSRRRDYGRDDNRKKEWGNRDDSRKRDYGRDDSRKKDWGNRDDSRRKDYGRDDNRKKEWGNRDDSRRKDYGRDDSRKKDWGNKDDSRKRDYGRDDDRKKDWGNRDDSRRKDYGGNSSPRKNYSKDNSRRNNY